MSQRIEFIIRGQIASDHRPKVSQFDSKGRRLRKPVVYPNKDYDRFRTRIRMTVRDALVGSTWRIPAKSVEMKLYIEAHVASLKKIVSKQKKIITRARTVPDEDNIIKCVKDSLQKPSKKHNPYNLPAKDIGFLYVDDQNVGAYPFPDRKWIYVEPGFDEWIVVALEVVGEFQPHVEQSKLNFGDTKTTRRPRPGNFVEEEF